MSSLGGGVGLTQFSSDTTNLRWQHDWPVGGEQFSVTVTEIRCQEKAGQITVN